MKKMIFCLIAVMMICCFAVNSSALEIEPIGVEIHGFISQGFLKSTLYNYLADDSKAGSFQFNEMGINFGKQVSDKLHIGIQLFARDLGNAANDKVTIDWAYADYRWRDWLGLRLGKIKLPRGLYNEIRDQDMLRGPIILPQGIYDELTRDTMIAIQGGSLYGYVPTGRLGSLEYQLLFGTMNVDMDSGVRKTMNSGLQGAATVDDVTVKNIYAGSLRWNTPVEGLALGASGNQFEMTAPVTYAAFVPVLGGKTDGMRAVTYEGIFSADYTRKNLTLQAEYYMRRQEAEFQLRPSSTTKGESYYLMASYRFSKWLEVGSYYSIYYPDITDRDGARKKAAGMTNGKGWQKDAALFLRSDITSYCTVKVEGHYVDGTAQVLSADNPAITDHDWWYFGAKVTFNF